jgi:hypothetical protein
LINIAPLIIVLSPIALPVPGINDHIPYSTLYETLEPNDTTMEYNYITIEKYTKEVLKKLEN